MTPVCLDLDDDVTSVSVLALQRKLGFDAVGEEEVRPGLTVTHFERRR